MTVPTLREMLFQDFEEDFAIQGGFGGSREDPVVFLPEARRSYPKNEYDIIRAICIGRGVSFKLLQQSMIEHNGKMLDQVKIETVETTATEIITSVENYYFDISACMAG